MKSLTRFTGILAFLTLIAVIVIGFRLSRKTAFIQEQRPSPARPSVAYSNYTEDDWKRILTPEQYYILREAGTEIPFTSPLVNEHRPGTYVTADCSEPVFRSEQKFDSGTGWPSFWAPINPIAITTSTDNTLLFERTEVRSRCGGHLGHVFTDGPPPTGLRYCMNGDALKFIPDEPK